MSQGRYRAYAEYRASGTDWMDDVPAQWTVVPVGRLFRRVKRIGHAKKELLSVYRDHGVVPTSSRDDNHNNPSEDLSPYQLVKVDDLVLNKMKAWQGSIAVSEHEGIVSPAYFVYSPVPRLFELAHQRYVHYLLRNPAYISQYLRRSKGIRVGQWDLDPEEFQLVELLLPTKTEQTQIAKFLDHETAKIDRLIEKQEALIRLLKEKRQAVISHAVTKGLNPHAPLKDSGIKWLGQVPAHWSIKPLKYLMSLMSGGTPSKENADYWEGNVPWASSKDLKSDELFDTQDHITQKALDRGAAELIPPGRILTVVRGMILLHTFPISVTRVPMAINQDLKALQPLPGISTDFLAWLLRGASDMVLSTTDEAGHGTKVLRMESWLAIQVPIPPPEEQAQIVAKIVERLGKLNDLTEDAHRAITLLQERRTALISAAVTGKIDVRHWQPPVGVSKMETTTAATA